jgi:CDP-diacylglycerol--serine O-phosphatidyltransferase
MPRLRTPASKRSLLRKVRRQRLNYVTVLPSLITMLNGLCGFTAIVLAGGSSKQILGGQFTALAAAGYMVLIAMIADVLDGRVARMSQNTSSFGGQLDSLCDVVSFGVAPAFIALKVLEHNVLNSDLGPVLQAYLQKFFWLVTAAYVSCAAIRLARFNVENEEDESAHTSFIGLPSPAAAGMLVSLVIFQQETIPELLERGSGAYEAMKNTVVFALPFVVLGTAALMVSRIRYTHVLNQYFKGKKPFAYLLTSLLALGLVCWVRQPALVACFGTFCASGLVGWLHRKLSHGKEFQERAVEDEPHSARGESEQTF